MQAPNIRTASARRNSPLVAATSFLRALWPTESLKGRLGLWGHGVPAEWFPISAAGVEGFARRAVEAGLSADVYVHCSAHDVREIEPGRRGRNDTATLLPGFWADCDFRRSGEPSEYPSKAELRSAIEALPILPSIIIETGGGFHLWWLLDEYAPADERTESLCKRWQECVRLTHGRKMDETGERARVLRVPGTHNLKRYARVSLKFLDESRRYSVEDFERVLDELGLAETATPGGIPFRNGIPLVAIPATDAEVAAYQPEAAIHGHGERTRAIRELVCELKRIPSFACLAVEQILPLFERWWSGCGHLARNSNSRDALRQFRNRWKSWDQSKRTALVRAMQAAEHGCEESAALCKSKGLRAESMLKLVRLCRELDRITNGREIALPQIPISQWLGIKQPAVSKHIARLVHAGILKPGRRGSSVSRRASEYFWTGGRP